MKIEKKETTKLLPRATANSQLEQWYTFMHQAPSALLDDEDNRWHFDTNFFCLLRSFIYGSGFDPSFVPYSSSSCLCLSFSLPAIKISIFFVFILESSSLIYHFYTGKEHKKFFLWRKLFFFFFKVSSLKHFIYFCVYARFYKCKRKHLGIL